MSALLLDRQRPFHNTLQEQDWDGDRWSDDSLADPAKPCELVPSVNSASATFFSHSPFDEILDKSPVGGNRGIESIFTIDERGHMVLPKRTRDRAGDRFALIAWSKNERVCCLSLSRTDELTEMVTGFLGSLAATAAEGEM